MLTESCVIVFCRPEPFKALFFEVIYRPVERETVDNIRIINHHSFSAQFHY